MRGAIFNNDNIWNDDTTEIKILHEQAKLTPVKCMHHRKSNLKKLARRELFT